MTHPGQFASALALIEPLRSGWLAVACGLVRVAVAGVLSGRSSGGCAGGLCGGRGLGGGRFPGLSGAAAWFRVIPRRALVRVLLMGFR